MKEIIPNNGILPNDGCIANYYWWSRHNETIWTPYRI